MTDEHEDRRKYLRYHCQVWMPTSVKEAAEDFLPPPGLTILPLSTHYREMMEERKLPTRLHMPKEFDIVDVTVARETMVIYRVMVRFRWNKRSDFVMVLEGDWEVVTGFWRNPKDWNLADEGPYQKPESEP